MHLVPQLGELGFLGASLSGYGCAGMSHVAYGQMMQELERGDSGLRSFVSVQGALVMYAIHTFGSPAQKEKWLPRLQKGTAIGCFGLTEPQAGSNPGAMLTRAETPRRGLHPERRKDVDHQRLSRRRCRRLGQRRRRAGARLPGGKRDRGTQNLGCAWQALHARQRDFGPELHGLRHSRGKPASRSRGTARTAGLPLRAGSLRHRLGARSARHMASLPDRARLCQDSPPVRKQAPRGPPNWFSANWSGWSPKSARRSCWRFRSAA